MSKNNFFKTALSFEGNVLDYYKYQQAIQYELLTIIKASLPSQLANHVLYCVASEKKLSIYTDSANWSSQLRFYHQQMRQKLSRSKHRQIEVLQIKIIPLVKQPQHKAKKIPSKENITCLFEQANSQTDEVLKTSLLKLATSLKKLSKTQ